ncbi:MAG: glycosyltransferase family 2 protein [Henriciella sp.]|nr:glycosyltransferase family 2 protein [Henriciella sp.]
MDTETNGLNVALISIVVPAYNEAESVKILTDEITAVMDEMDQAFEIIFVDDGSTDETPKALAELSSDHEHIKTITFRRNFGKAAALDAGFSAAQGEIVFTMDADLQDDPAEIPNFLRAIAEGADVVSGWKHVRHDPIDKTLPSKVFNGVVGRLSAVKLNDFNCGFKAYRSEALEALTLYGELHRFIPVLLHWKGFRIAEVPVNHRARQYGKSKYGISRLFKGALDLMGVMLNTRFATRPLHVFGGAGMVFGTIGFAALSYLTVLWFIGAGPIGNRPLLLFGMLMVMTAFQFLTIGLLGEFIQRQSATKQRRYTIRDTQNIQLRRRSTGHLVDDLLLAAARMKEAQAKWTPQPFATTQPSDTSTNTPTKTRSTS